MIIIDVRDFEEGLTLADVTELIHRAKSLSCPNITVEPDRLLISKWQAENIFTSRIGQWDYFRTLPLVVEKESP